MLIFTSLIYKKYKSHSKNKNKLKQEINTKHKKMERTYKHAHGTQSCFALSFLIPLAAHSPPSQVL